MVQTKKSYRVLFEILLLEIYLFYITVRNIRDLNIRGREDDDGTGRGRGNPASSCRVAKCLRSLFSTFS